MPQSDVQECPSISGGFSVWHIDWKPLGGVGLFQILKSPHLTAGLWCAGSHCHRSEQRNVACQSPAIHFKMKETKGESQGMGINETYFKLFQWLGVGNGSHSQHRCMTDLQCFTFSGWLLGAVSVEDSKGLLVDRRAVGLAAGRRGGDAWQHLRPMLASVPEIPRHRMQPQLASSTLVWSNVQWGFHCTTVTSHRLTRASPLTADELEHPPGCLGSLSASSFWDTLFLVHLNTLVLSLTLPTLNRELRLPLPMCSHCSPSTSALKEKKSGSNWNLLHASRMFPVFSVALHVSVKPVVLGQTQVCLALYAGVLQ